MREKRVGGVILAAGKSDRMSCCKLLLPFDEKGCVLAAVIRHAQEAGISPLIVVCGAEREKVEAIAAQAGVACVYNPDYAQGQSTSLQCGLQALPPDTAAMFLLGDQPLIRPDTLRLLIEAYQMGRAQILVPQTEDGVRGNPSLFAPELFAELRQIRGDVGGRPVLRAHIDEIFYVTVEDEGILADLDTPAQYEAMRTIAQRDTVNESV